MAILTMLVLAQANNFTPPTLYETEVHPQLQGVDPRNTPATGVRVCVCGAFATARNIRC